MNALSRGCSIRQESDDDVTMRNWGGNPRPGGDGFAALPASGRKRRPAEVPAATVLGTGVYTEENRPSGAGNRFIARKWRGLHGDMLTGGESSPPA